LETLGQRTAKKHREAKKQKQKQQKQPKIRSEKENAKNLSTQL
jgi:hypothetical protein